MGLGTALGTLWLMGEPPAVRIDSVWVNAHRREVQVVFVAVGVALVAGLVAALGRGSRQWIVAALWTAAAGCAFGLFERRLIVIVTVVAKHSGLSL